MDSKLNDLVETLAVTKGVGLSLPSVTLGDDFGLDAAYKVAHGLHERSVDQGRSLAGRKIGLSNKSTWDKLGISDIVWGYVYEDTVTYAKANQASISVGEFSSPRIEPEIVFKLKAAESPMSLKNIEWMALGFEIVQCPYPGWKFKPQDLVATFGYHAALIIGEPRVITPDADLDRILAEFKAVLYKGGEVVGTGGGFNVVDSPGVAMEQLADLISKDPAAPPLAAGEVITTGALTPAPDIAPGETYRFEATELGLVPLTLELV